MLVIAAFILPQYVGALPIFFGGVNSTVVTRLIRPGLGSKLFDVRLEPALLCCVRALSVVPRLAAEGGRASSVTCLLGCWRRRGPAEAVLAVSVGKLLDTIGVVEDDWGSYSGSFGELNGESLTGGSSWVSGGKETRRGSDIVG